MGPNIGIINALMRLTAGFTVLAWITSKMVRRPYRDSYLVVALLAAMKIGEGILRYCPLTDLFDRFQDYRGHDDDYDFDFEDFQQQAEGEGGASESYNPS
ncbi:YgaP-like transmembrane domain [Sutcliffiella halmapala]|uniref:YgaP-like transmembrane domain n=1 Tax=Sutcliffiella halmapala TaxID=79882 RepID=UPI002287172D|nr:YgaP-like transmembrane domain [Sutcliffiella halmapala]